MICPTETSSAYLGCYVEYYWAFGSKARMDSSRLRRKRPGVLAAAQRRPRWQTQMRKERRFPLNSC